MNLACDLTVVVLVVLAAYFDVKERRIPNWLVLSGLFLGIIFAVSENGGQLFSSLFGFVLGILVLLLPFAFGWMGAGDVKLLGTVGALLGYRLLPRVFFYSCIGAGIMALLAVVLGKVKKTNFVSLWTNCTLAVLTAGRSVTRADIGRLSSDAYSVPWGVAIGTGTIMAYFIDTSGKWAGF